jgi:hypothetical protein
LPPTFRNALLKAPDVENKPAKPAQPSGKLPSVATQRTLAKTGMGLSMGVLVWSAMVRGRKAMRYHTLAGVAMIGFSVWHIALYKARNKIYEE